MYEVSIMQYGETKKYIHRGNVRLPSASITHEINAISSFVFEIFPNNVGYNLLNDYTTLIDVYNTKTGKYDFHGRVLMQKDTMGTDGTIAKNVTCESRFGFLCDSVQSYIGVQNWTVSGLFTALIDAHNAQVEEYKRFTVGTVTATDDNDNLYLGVDRVNTWTAIKECLINKIGGELQFRVENGVNYIDYLDKIGDTKATTIKVRHNMQAITREADPSSYITRLIPLGAKITDENGKETEQRVDITSVNDGINYIEDTQGVENYGIHYGVEYWDDVTTPKILRTKAVNWLTANNKIHQKISVDAVELALLGIDIDYIDLYNSYPVENDLMGIAETLRVIRKTIDLNTRGVSSVEFGDTFKTLTQKQAEKDKEIAKAVESAKKIENVVANYVTNEELTGAIAGVGVEGINDELEEIRQEIVTATTEISQSTEEIILGAVEQLVSTGDFDTFKNEVSTQLNILSDELTVKFSNAITEIETVENEAQTKFVTLESYIRGYMNAEGKPVVELGSAQSLIMLKLENDRIAFLQNGIELMYVTGNTINITDGKFYNSLQIGTFGFIPRANGSLDFKKV